MARLSDLVQRRSFGFAGPEGEMFDEQNSLASLSRPITNESIAGQRMPQNYIQRTGGQVQDMGPSGRDVRIQGLPAILHPDNENLTVYAPSGKQYQTTVSEQRQIEAENKRRAEMKDLPRRMALAKVQEQEAKAKGGGLSPADMLAREKFEWEKSGGKSAAKPMPATALRMQNEALDSIGASNALRSDLLAFKSEIDKGTLPLGPIQNKMYEAQNWAGSSSPESKKYASFKANLERLRNESLRLNKGVQTEGDAIRAWNEVLASINDPELVSDRLEEIANINQRGAQLKKLEVDNIRANYGNDPMDVSEFEKQTPAYNYGENEDEVAIAWAKAHSNDPMARKILELHGM